MNLSLSLIAVALYVVTTVGLGCVAAEFVCGNPTKKKDDYEN